MADDSKNIQPEKLVKAILDEVIDQLADANVDPEDLEGISIFTGIAIEKEGREQLYVVATSSQNYSQTKLVTKFIARMVAAGDLKIEDIIDAASKVSFEEGDGNTSKAEQRIVKIKDDEIHTVHKKVTRDNSEDASLKKKKKKEEEEPKKDVGSSVMDKLKRFGKL